MLNQSVRWCVIAAIATLAAAASRQGVAAAETQDLATIRSAVERAAAARIAMNGADVQIEVSAIDSRLQLPACPSLGIDLPPNTTASMTAKVTCIQPQWTIYVPLRVHAWTEAIVAAGNLPPNRALSAGDFSRGKVDIFAAPGGVITDPKQVQGKILRAGLVVGSPILSTMLDQPISVHRGQRVVLTASDSAMTVKTAGVAMEDGRVGDHISVQNPDSQKTVNATVTRDGGVEIKF